MHFQLQTSIIIAISSFFLLSAALPSGSDTSGLIVRVVDARSPIPGPHDLASLSSDLVQFDPEKRAGPAEIGLVAGVIAGLGTFASKACKPVFVGTAAWLAASACVVSALSFLAGSLFSIWKAFENDEAVAHYASMGMVAVHTSALIPDTPLLLAEHACTGQDCHQIWYHHNSTENIKKVSLVPKVASKRQDGTVHDEPTSEASFFMDYVWDNSNEGEESAIANAGQQAANNAIVNTVGQSSEYQQSGHYCAVWTDSGGHADRGAIFQNQGSSYPYQSGEAASVAGGCS